MGGQYCVPNTGYRCLLARIVPWTTAALLLWVQAANAQTVIDTIQQLEAINTDLSGNYVLGANIDASTAAGFVPIGNLSNPFTGTLNGEGFTISNLTINSSLSDVGLFGVVGSAGDIANVGLTNVSVTQNGSGLTGGLVGQNSGVITQSFVTGSVTAPANSNSLGLLAGNNYGTISNSYSAGSVTITAGTAPGYNSTGGLVGINGGQLTQSYSTASVTGSGATGQLLGWNNGNVSYTYAIAGSNPLIGYINTGNVANSFTFTAAQFQSGLPPGFDPTVWGSNPSINNGYPYLLTPVPSPSQTVLTVNVTLGEPSATKQPTSIFMTFTPPPGVTLAQAAASLGYKGFDWVQQVISPTAPPAPAVPSLDPQGLSYIQLIPQGFSFLDPIPGGYPYDPRTAGSYPFYYNPSGSLADPYSLLANENDNSLYCPYANTLCFYDHPSNASFAQTGGQTTFITELVGLAPCTAETPTTQCNNGLTYGSPLFSEIWTSSFDGCPTDNSGACITDNSGGITVIFNSYPGEFNFSDGSGGITQVPLNPTPLPPMWPVSFVAFGAFYYLARKNTFRNDRFKLQV